MTASAHPPSPDDAASTTDPTADTSGGDEGEWGAGRLSVDDADRFAAEFRPSWESPEGDWSAAPSEAAQETTEAAQEPAEAAQEPAEAAQEPAEAAKEPTPKAPEPEPEPEPSVIIAADAVPEESVIVAASIAPPAPTPVRPRRVTDPSAFDAQLPDEVLTSSGPKRGLLYGAIGVAAVVVLAVVAMNIGDSEDTTADVSDIASAPSEASPGTETVTAGEAEAPTESATGAAVPSEAPPEVQVSIRTEPANARLTVDGELVDNPYQTATTAGGTHTVVATAVGFEGSSESVSFGENVDLTVHLAALTPAPAPAGMATPRRSAMAAARSRARRPAMMARPRTAAMRSTRMSMGFTSTNPY